MTRNFHFSGKWKIQIADFAALRGREGRPGQGCDIQLFFMGSCLLRLGNCINRISFKNVPGYSLGKLLNFGYYLKSRFYVIPKK